jgi:lysophospholipase L1-like esterase
VTCCLLILGGCSSQTDTSTSSRPLQVQQIPKARITYVAIGASDTYGIGADDPATENWPTDLAQKLGTDVHLINLGVPGIDIHDALNVELPIALDAHPSLVTIWLAINDIADHVPINTYTHDFNQFLSELQAGVPQARIVVANVPDLTLLPYFSSSDPQVLSAQVQDYNAAITTAVRQHHGILVDLFQHWTELKDHSEYISSDGLHPSTLGYTRLAELFYQALQP